MTDVFDKEAESARLVEKERRRRERELTDVREVIDSPQGRRFVWRLLSDARVFASCFVAGDPHSTSANEGKRDMGLLILNDLMVARPEAFAQMQREFISEQKQQLEEEKKLKEKEA